MPISAHTLTGKILARGVAHVVRGTHSRNTFGKPWGKVGLQPDATMSSAIPTT